MSDREQEDIAEEKPRAKWGDASTECFVHEAEIRSLQHMRFSLKAIWRKLQDERKITVKYHAFRSAVQKFDRTGTQEHATEEKGKPQLPPLRGESVPPQSSKKAEAPAPSEDARGKQSGPITISTGVKQFDRNI